MEIEENPANSLVKPSDSGDEWAKSGEVIRDLSNESAKRGEGSVKGNEAGITTSARTSFELVGADWRAVKDGGRQVRGRLIVEV